MFCTTMRQRPQLAPLIPHLMKSASPTILESRLLTHDIALPVRSMQQGENAKQTVLILTHNDVDDVHTTTTVSRISRFATLVASPPPLILIVSNTKIAANRLNNTTNQGLHTSDPYAIALLNKLVYENEIRPCPILPVPSFNDVMPLLRTYMQNHVPHRPTIPDPRASALSLLPIMTCSGPLTQHQANILTDLCGSVREVVELVRTKQGRDQMRQFLDPGVVEGIRAFWWGGEQL